MLSSVTINSQVTKIVIKSRFSIVSIVANVTSPYALLENTLNVRSSRLILCLGSLLEGVF